MALRLKSTSSNPSRPRLSLVTMPSSISLLLTSFLLLLTLDLCSPSPSGPTGPSGPGFQCNFGPVTYLGPDTTTPQYNAALVSQYSVSEFIQCAGEDSTLEINDDPNPLNALSVLVNATKTCGQYKLSEVIQDYSQTDHKVKLTRYLCGKASDNDVCSLSTCLGVAKAPVYSLKGICQNDNPNLRSNPRICGSSGGDDEEPAATTDGTAAASSSINVSKASEPTATPSTSSSSGTATTTGSSSNATPRILAGGLGELIAAGVSLIVLMAIL